MVLTFGVVLLIAVALSGLAARTVLSTALVFLLAGALVEPDAARPSPISSPRFPQWHCAQD